MKVICLILGGGRGSRLYPLTKARSKPAVPIAGKYRIIDIPISNCLHSGLNHIYILTQFNSVSLHRHITNAYHFDVFSGGFVELLAAQQTMEHDTWYQGTADAVRRNLGYFADSDYDLVLILSGDQLYRMDFQAMIRTHSEARADATIAVLPVAEASARSFGIMQLDETGRVADFVEKPQSAEVLNRVRSNPAWMKARFGIDAPNRPFLASMGIYLFNKSTLVDLLDRSRTADFGKEVFPQTIHSRKVQAHLFDGYWEDIGTIGAFHQANLDLTGPNPPFDFYFGDHPIFTRPRFLPCSRLAGVTVTDSLIADGCTIGKGSVIEHSVIGVRAQIAENVVIRDSYIMGSDTFERPDQLLENERAGQPRIGIGANSRIEKAIIDKHSRIGRNVRLVNEAKVIDSPSSEDESSRALIRDGIIVVPRFTVVPDDYVV